MADVMVAAGIDAAGNIDVQPAKVAREVEVPEAARQFLRHRDRAGIGEAAIIEARTGDDVRNEPHIRRRKAVPVECAPDLRQVALRDMRQHQVLLVADTDFAEREAVGEIGYDVHLLGGGVAGRTAFRLERERHDRVARNLVVGDGVPQPSGEPRIGPAQGRDLGRVVGELFIVRIAKPRGDVGDDGRLECERAVLDRQPFRFDLVGEAFGAELVDEILIRAL